jgi:ABC-type transport system involved in cytochrome bd biosynthesis fused ATPase/permease subunit
LPVAGLIVIALLVGHFPVLSKLTALQQSVIPAKLAVYVFVFLLAFLLGFRTADRRAEAKALRAEIAQKNEVIAAKDLDLHLALEAAEAAQKQRDEAALRAKTVQDEMDDYAQRLKARPNASCVLIPDDFPGSVPDHAKR